MQRKTIYFKRLLKKQHLDNQAEGFMLMKRHSTTCVQIACIDLPYRIANGLPIAQSNAIKLTWAKSIDELAQLPDY